MELDRRAVERSQDCASLLPREAHHLGPEEQGRLQLVPQRLVEERREIPQQPVLDRDAAEQHSSSFRRSARSVVRRERETRFRARGVANAAAAWGLRAACFR
jgi:hypothetical protein